MWFHCAMAKNSFYVNLLLDSPQCTMISPWYEYDREKIGIPERKSRNPDNLIKLEQMVSNTMIARRQQELTDVLDKKLPLLYINCMKKWDDDIMLFIFKEYLKQSQAKHIRDIVTQAIWRHSIVTGSREQWNQYIAANAPTLEEILHYYSTSLKTLLAANPDEEYMRRLLDFESDITTNGIGELMADAWKKYLYLYLDNIESLSITEQQRINTLLYTRWSIPNTSTIMLKINNGQWLWKTRYSTTGHRVESPHDYSETTIREHELV